MAATTVEPLLLNFNGGELSPLMDGRVDTAIRQAGCRTLVNFIPLRQGPATRRPGTRWIAATKAADDEVWLLDFVFDRVQAYTLEFGLGYMRFFTQGGVLEDGMGAPFELAHDWDEPEDLTDADGRCRIDMTTRGDRLWLVNGRREPLVISRRGAIDWTAESFFPLDGPFLPENLGPITITASAVTGSAITLTASDDLFVGGHVGALVRLFAPAYAAVQPWRSNEAVTAGDQRRNDGRVYEALANGTTSTIPPTHDEGDASDGEVDWRHLHPLFGVARINVRTSATEVEADVVRRLPDEVVSGVTARWQLGAWSDAADTWPSAVTFFRERLTFARGRFLWQSRSRDYEAFADRTTAIEQLADDGIALELVADFPVDIQWLAPIRDVMLLGTGQGELAITKQTPTEPYGPLNITQNPVTDFGAAKLRPLRAADQRILMLQAAGQSIVELAYRIEDDAIGGRDLSVFADHLTEAGILDWAWQQRPDGILWCRTGDDELLGLTYSPEQQIVAFHRHRLGGGGRLKRLRCIPRPTHDELWLIVERGSGAGLSRSVEVMQRRWRPGLPVADYFGVDAGLTLDSETDVTAIAGLDHLEGQAVIGLTDGAEHPPVTVADGEIDLAWPTKKAHVGLAIESDLEPMPIEVPTNRGTAQGAKKRVQSVVVRLLDTLQCQLGAGPGRLQNVILRSPATPLGSPEPPRSGDFEVRDFPGDWQLQESIYLRMAGAGPGTVVVLRPQLMLSR